MHINASRFNTSPLEMVKCLVRHRQLIWQMTKRDVIGRYRGSMMGILWSFLNPMIMLAVYTFVFGVVLKTRWNNQSDNTLEFAIALFTGMIIHGLFAECVNRAPSIILSNANYVKKVIFPLEILPWISMGSTLFHSSASTLVLLSLYASVHASLNWTLIFFPLLLLPLILLTMGFSWFLAAISVYIRDVGQTIGLVTTAMMFLSPVCYPITALPEKYRFYIQLNPMTFIIEQTRDVILWGNMPDWQGLAIYSIFSFLMAWAGFFWFQKTRKGFADVL